MEALGLLLVAALCIGGLWYLCQFVLPDSTTDERRELRKKDES